MSIPQTAPTTRMSVGSYSVRPSSNNSRFRITIPTNAMRECNIDDGDRLAVEPVLGTDGQVTLRYIPEAYAPDGQMTVAVNEYNSGVTRIPSATGQAFGFGDEHEIDWNIIDEPLVHADAAELEFVDEDEDNPMVPVLQGETNLTLPEVTPASALPMSREPVTRKVQSGVEREGNEWSQEQFRYYLAEQEMETLGWNSGIEVAVTVKRREERPAMVFTPVDDAENTRLTKTVNATSADNNYEDGLLYISRDIVRGFGFVETPLMWVNDDGRLVATKTGRNR